MSVRLYVGNLSNKVTFSELKKLFSTKGEVFIATMKESGWGFVEMQTQIGARKAIESLNGYNWHDRSLVVQYAEYSTPDYPQKTHEGRRFTSAGTRAANYRTRKPNPN